MAHGTDSSAPGELESLTADTTPMVNFWWGVRGAVESHITPEHSGGAAMALEPGAFTVSATRLAKNDGASTDYSLVADRTGVSAGVERRTLGRALSFEAYAAPGWIEIDAAALWNLTPGRLWGSSSHGTLGFATSVAGWSDFVGLGLELDRGLSPRLGVFSGIFGTVSGRREVKYLGSYLGARPELQGQHAVEIEDSTGRWISLSAGLDTGGIGLGLTGNRQTARMLALRTYVPVSVARALVADESGRWAKLVENLRVAVDLPRGGRTLPDLSNPLKTMRLHDEVRLTVDRETQCLLMGGCTTAKLGAVATVRGRFEMIVRRLPPERTQPGGLVEVSARLVDLRQVGLFGSVAPGVGVDGTLDFSFSRREAFVFDLERPAARVAYLRLLAGDVPIAVERVRSKTTREIAEELRSKFATDGLAPGVRRTFVERVDLESAGFYLGTRVFFLTVGSDYAGLSRSIANFSERSLATDGETVVCREIRASRRRNQFLTFGEIERSVFASHSRVLGDEGENGAWRFRDVTLNAVFSDSRVSKNAQNSELVDVLNRLFDAELRRFERPGRRHGRELVLERKLDARALQALAKSDEARIAATAVRTRIPARRLRDLSQSLANTPVNLAAKRVTRFVARNGLEGLAAVHHLVSGAPRDLVLRSTSSAYSEPIEEARKLMLLGTPSPPPSRETRPSETLLRACRLLRQLEEALRDLADDPFFVSEDAEPGPSRGSRASWASPLRAARADVEAVVATVTRSDIAKMDTQTLESLWLGSEGLILERESAGEPISAEAARVLATVRTELSERRARILAMLPLRLQEIGLL